MEISDVISFLLHNIILLHLVCSYVLLVNIHYNTIHKNWQHMLNISLHILSSETSYTINVINHCTNMGGNLGQKALNETCEIESSAQSMTMSVHQQPIALLHLRLYLHMRCNGLLGYMYINIRGCIYTPYKYGGQLMPKDIKWILWNLMVSIYSLALSVP